MGKEHNSRNPGQDQSQISVAAAYIQAVEHFNAGRYTEADRLCTAIIQAIPTHIDAINLLGVVAQNVNRHDLAVELFQRAINIDGTSAIYHQNLGISLNHLQRYVETIAAFQNALARDATNVQTIIYLGAVYEKTGKLDDAVASYQQALLINPGFAEAYSTLGYVLYAQGNLEAAIENCQKAVSINPDFAEAYSNLGTALYAQGNLEAAVYNYQKAIASSPDFAEAHCNLGNTYKEQGNLEAAVVSLQKAIAIKPDFVEAHSNLGNTLNAQGKFDQAVISLNKAISIKPDFAAAQSNLGNALKEQGKIAEATACYQKAIAFEPDYADAHNNLGNALAEQGKMAAAILSYQKAILVEPDFIDAYNNLGNALKEQGKMEESVTIFQKAMYLRLQNLAVDEIPPDYPGSNNFYIELTNRCNFHCTFCPSDDQTRTIGEMSLELVKKIFTEIANKKLSQTVNLHQMGEPTLYRHLKEVLQLAAKCGLKVDLVTNGSTLTQGNIDFLLNELNGQLIVSLQTPTENSFKLRKTKMLWENYLGYIQDLLAAYLGRIARGNSLNQNSAVERMHMAQDLDSPAEFWLKCKIQVRLMKTDGQHSNVDILSNRESIIKQIKYWSKLVSSAELREGLTPYPRKQLSLLSDDWFSQNNSSYVLHTGITLVFWSNFTFANTIINPDSKLSNLNNTKFCFHPFSDMSILWDGRCVPCCLDYDGELDVGNANIDSLESILMNNKATQLRKAFLGQAPIPDYCKKCQADLV